MALLLSYCDSAGPWHQQDIYIMCVYSVAGGLSGGPYEQGMGGPMSRVWVTSGLPSPEKSSGPGVPFRMGG